MVHIYQLAHIVWNITKWITGIVGTFLIAYAANVAAFPGQGIPPTPLGSLMNFLLLPGLNRTLTLCTLGLLLAITISTRVLITIEKRKLKELAASTGEEKNRLCLLKALPKTSVCVTQWKGLDTFIFKVVWSPDGNLLASAGSEGIVQLWNGNNFQLIKQLSPEGESIDWLRDLAWSPDSQFLIAAGEDKESRIWNVDTGTIQEVFRHPASPILSFGWYMNGIGAVAESGWSAFCAPPISGAWEQFSATTTPMQTAAWAWHSVVLATVSINGELFIHRERVANRLTRLDPSTQQVQALSWSTLDTCLAAGCKDGCIQIWDVNQLTKVSEWNTQQQDISVLCWTQKGRYLISGDSKGVIRIWDTVKGQVLQEFDTYNGSITALAISPHTGFLCSAHEKGSLSVWKLRSRIKRIK